MSLGWIRLVLILNMNIEDQLKHNLGFGKELSSLGRGILSESRDRPWLTGVHNIPFLNRRKHFSVVWEHTQRSFFNNKRPQFSVVSKQFCFIRNYRNHFLFLGIQLLVPLNLMKIKKKKRSLMWLKKRGP